MSIRIGILGYGNLGRGVECAVKANDDMELAVVFTRRDPAKVKISTAGVPVVHADEAANWQNKIDVLILCGGSATDLPVQTPAFAKLLASLGGDLAAFYERCEKIGDMDDTEARHQALKNAGSSCVSPSSPTPCASHRWSRHKS